MYNSVIEILKISIEEGLIDKSEGKSAIILLSIRPGERVNRIARKFHLLKDEYFKYWAADEGLKHLNSIFEEELSELQMLIGGIEADIENGIERVSANNTKGGETNEIEDA